MIFIPIFIRINIYVFIPTKIFIMRPIKLSIKLTDINEQNDKWTMTSWTWTTQQHAVAQRIKNALQRLQCQCHISENNPPVLEVLDPEIPYKKQDNKQTNAPFMPTFRR